MATEQPNIIELRRAVELALGDQWDDAHVIVQGLGDEPSACWLHAVLHKIEGDVVNARYWYARCDHAFDDYEDATAELVAIEQQLGESSS